MYLQKQMLADPRESKHASSQESIHTASEQHIHTVQQSKHQWQSFRTDITNIENQFQKSRTQ